MNIYEEAKHTAEVARRRLELDNAPIKDIFSLLENEGIFVVRMPISGDGLSGAFYYNKTANLARVLVNSDRTLGHQIFTAAHEYGHYLMDKDKDILIIERDNGKTNIEKRADAFSANFLMPEEGVKNFITNVLEIGGKTLNDPGIVKIRNEFNASWAATLYRLHNLGYRFDKDVEDKKNQTALLNSLARQMGYKPEKRFGIEKTLLPSEFYQRAYAAYFNKKISLNRLAEILRCSYDEAKDSVAEIEAIEKNGQNI